MSVQILNTDLASQTQTRLIKEFRRQTAIAAFTVLATALAIYAGRTSEAPYLWAVGAVTIIFGCAASISTRPWTRALWVNLAVLTLACGAGEAYFWMNEPLERQMQYSEGFFLADEILGYKPAAGQALSHRTSARHELLYQITYTINQDGLRTASPTDAGTPSDAPCVAFFGDSFTFGEGMSDEQTMPYQVWQKLGGRYRTVNFGFLGYGPQQMLAALQHNRLESQGHCRPSHIIYEAIPTHVSRAAGLEAWDHHGPRYLLKAEGHVQQVGHFDDFPPVTALDRLRATHRQLSAPLKIRLEQSALYRMLLRSHRPVDAEDVALFGGIVGDARQLIETTYPGAEFHVIFWDYDDDQEVVDKVQRELARRGVHISAVSTILSHFPGDRARYEISPYDRHPNILAHETIAEFVAHTLVLSGR